MKKQIIILACALALSSVSGIRPSTSSKISTTNPLLPGSGWTFGEGDNSNNQFSWDSTTSSLNVNINSSLPTARLDTPIGATFTGSSDFTLTAAVQFHGHQRARRPGIFAQFAFGLTNSATTGGDRTGSLSNFSSDNTFNTVEFDYFPQCQDSIFGGPTLTPVVIGAQSGWQWCLF